MLAQLRSRYPTGSLISELLTIYLGKYVVRAVVEIDGVILTTGLAAADTVELAEDQAKKRAIQSLDLDTTRPQPSIPRELLKPTPPELKPEVSTAVSVPAVPPTLESPPPFAPSSIPDEDSGGIPSGSLTSDDWLSATYIQPKTDKTPDNETESKSKGSKGRSASLPPVPASPEGVPTYPDEPEFSQASAGSGRSLETTDFSSDIAKTDIELKRLRWTQEQGRAHLQKTYGKRSRQHLTDNELLDFLHYLESLSTPTESP
ncbi:conserved hypothetical protein [Planktothrix sp. PCC 11201]|uniref:hypothetical protein n=1 Tax=Planktothrix sp. PCC 11201 TaxID=1729650 RepID=UPI000922D44A|nr:hypothetical protein [Planktothrix sp. PCC 11201]SKB13414.1 conserved hypothetical protein [Planktothrix sp. PCC 11201]